MILMIFLQFCLHSSNSFTWQIAQFDQALGCNAFHCFPVWRLELEAYARYSSYKDAWRMKRSQPCKRFTVRTSGKINLLDESVNEVARKGGKCGGSWGSQVSRHYFLSLSSFGSLHHALWSFRLGNLL